MISFEMPVGESYPGFITQLAETFPDPNAMPYTLIRAGDTVCWDKHVRLQAHPMRDVFESLSPAGELWLATNMPAAAIKIKHRKRRTRK